MDEETGVTPEDFGRTVRDLRRVAERHGLTVPVVTTSPVERRVIRWRSRGPVVVLPPVRDRDDDEVTADLIAGIVAANRHTDCSGFLEAV